MVGFKNLKSFIKFLFFSSLKAFSKVLIVTGRLFFSYFNGIFLIKANTDFPNVIFLLLFQKDIVEKKLSDSTQSGENYLEKIIQIPFTI
ncbi:P-loop NTPase fold protein, partial [Cetobacterium sp.]|uniref:P-loop NTPase fold protein n=1 Tax=Cetobacterium sp. TaxID=2071632 RepID=UPI003FA5D83A